MVVGCYGDRLRGRPTRGLSGLFSPWSCPGPEPPLGAWWGGAWGGERLPAEGQQTHDDDGRAELLHAFLDDDAINGPAGVVGEECLSCRETGAQGAPAARGLVPFLPSPWKPTRRQQTPLPTLAGSGWGSPLPPTFG